MKALTGSEKQIEWATRIRQEFADSLDSKRTFRLSPESLEIVKGRARHYLETEANAGWWISNFKDSAQWSALMGFPIKYGMMIDGAGEFQIGQP